MVYQEQGGDIFQDSWGYFGRQEHCSISTNIGE